jgi:RNA polymerase sigma-70 factor (ECF subfamily)
VDDRRSNPVGVPADAGAPAAADVSAHLGRLLRSCAHGDESAFAAFYDATSSRAWGLALRVVRNPAHAEEVLQEAYLRTWCQSSRFDPQRGRAESWFLTIVHRTAVDRVRSAEASTRREQHYTVRDQTIPDPDATASAVQQTFEARRVHGALGALTELQRQAIELAYWGGYTHTEVAGLLNIPVGTAKTRIRDGLIRLRDTLGVEA